MRPRQGALSPARAATSCPRVAATCPIVRASASRRASARASGIAVRSSGRRRAGRVAPWHRAPTRPESRPSSPAGSATMATQDIAAALQRVESVLRRRPDVGLHDDAPATARWERGTRVVASHANGTQVATDMPTELGGTGDQVTPGLAVPRGLASCAATRIALAAAAEGIELTALEVRATQPLGRARPARHGGRRRRAGARRAARRAAARADRRARTSRPSACARWSRTAAAARRSRLRGRAPLPVDAAHRRRCDRLMDALSETLRVVRLVGAIFINGRFTAPWCYQSPQRRHGGAAARARRRARGDLPPDHRRRVLRRDGRRSRRCG